MRLGNMIFIPDHTLYKEPRDNIGSFVVWFRECGFVSELVALLEKKPTFPPQSPLMNALKLHR
jgi:hypothetical protein